ncbi:hypothetical protein ACVWZB_004779 [Paenibacillus polymyxa]
MEKLNELITEIDQKLQEYLALSMQGETRCPERTYAVGMSEAYNEALNGLYELRAELSHEVRMSEANHDALNRMYALDALATEDSHQESFMRRSMTGEEEEILISFLSLENVRIQVWSDTTLTVGHNDSVDYYVVPHSESTGRDDFKGYSFVGDHKGYHIYRN